MEIVTGSTRRSWCWAPLTRGMGERDVAPDVVTVFQISTSNELVIEGKATIRKRVAEVDEHYRVEFVNKPGATYQRFVDSWGQDDPEKYVQDFNRRALRDKIA